MWLKILEISNVWYFDATGSILKDVKNQQKPLLYSIVCHDTIHNQIIPVFEFHTTSHTDTTISRYLIYFKNALQTFGESSRSLIPPFIVVDFSWALINSSLQVFNGFSVSQYLNMTYEIIFNCKKESDINFFALKTRIYICSTHFLKTAIKKARKLANVPADVVTAFIYLFSLLQNSTSIKEFESYLKRIFLLFNQPKCTRLVLLSLKNLSSAVLNRNLSNIINDLNENTEIKEKQEEQNLIISDEEYENYKKESPFTIYFDKVILTYEKLIKKRDKLKKDNYFFYPELFAIIRDCLHIFPFWTGVLIKDYNNRTKKFEGVTRFTNNPVECYFKILKHSIIHRKKVRKKYSYIQFS